MVSHRNSAKKLLPTQLLPISLETDTIIYCVAEGVRTETSMSSVLKLLQGHPATLNIKCEAVKKYTSLFENLDLCPPSKITPSKIIDSHIHIPIISTKIIDSKKLLFDLNDKLEAISPFINQEKDLSDKCNKWFDNFKLNFRDNIKLLCQNYITFNYEICEDKDKDKDKDKDNKYLKEHNTELNEKERQKISESILILLCDFIEHNKYKVSQGTEQGTEQSTEQNILYLTEEERKTVSNIIDNECFKPVFELFEDFIEKYLKEHITKPISIEIQNKIDKCCNKTNLCAQSPTDEARPAKASKEINNLYLQ